MRGLVSIIAETPEVGSAVTATLESHGFHVTIIPSDEDPIRVIERGGFDVLVIEAGIDANSSSLAFLRSLAAAAQHLLARVVVITSDASPHVEQALESAGICDVVGKPVHADDIVAAVEACMDRTSATLH